MIKGGFGDADKRPYVQGRLFLPEFNLFDEIDFLVDTGADVSALFPQDALRIGVDYKQLGCKKFPLNGIGGSANPHKVTAVIIFDDGPNVHFYTRPIAVFPVHEDYEHWSSLIGQDILRHWQMIHDFQNHRLEFIVHSSDFTA